MKTIDFEEFLAEKCDTHTNNDPAGFENWEEQLDVQEIEDYAQEFGEKCYLQGKEKVLGKMTPMIEDFKDLIKSNPLDLLGK